MQREGPDGRDKEMRLSRGTVGDSCLFELGQRNGRSEKIAANRNDFMEAGWWSKRGSSHAGRVGTRAPASHSGPEREMELNRC